MPFGQIAGGALQILGAHVRGRGIDQVAGQKLARCHRERAVGVDTLRCDQPGGRRLGLFVAGKAVLREQPAQGAQRHVDALRSVGQTPVAGGQALGGLGKHPAVAAGRARRADAVKRPDQRAVPVGQQADLARLAGKALRPCPCPRWRTDFVRQLGALGPGPDQPEGQSLGIGRGKGGRGRAKQHGQTCSFAGRNRPPRRGRLASAPGRGKPMRGRDDAAARTRLCGQRERPWRRGKNASPFAADPRSRSASGCRCGPAAHRWRPARPDCVVRRSGPRRPPRRPA